MRTRCINRHVLSALSSNRTPKFNILFPSRRAHPEKVVRSHDHTHFQHRHTLTFISYFLILHRTFSSHKLCAYRSWHADIRIDGTQQTIINRYAYSCPSPDHQGTRYARSNSSQTFKNSPNSVYKIQINQYRHLLNRPRAELIITLRFIQARH